MSGPEEPSAVALIPARLASTRFPRKVLASDTGHPLVWHVSEAAGRARFVSRVVVAADHEEIRLALEPLGIEVVPTSPDHPNGTSRIGEAAARLGLEPDRIVVNVQGDEPEIDPRAIDAAIDALLRLGTDAATLASPFAAGDDPADPNVVKVVASPASHALYFSRALIPHPADEGSGAARPLRHVGVYTCRRRFLDEYARMEPTPLERMERLEQLRILEHGRTIGVALCERAHAGIDTPEQYAAFVRRLREAAPSRDQ